MKIELFTASHCPNCPYAKAKLKLAEIGFTEVNTDEDRERLNLYMLGSCETPTLVVTEDDGRKDLYIGIEDIDTFIKATKNNSHKDGGE